jgi:DDE superfamily endonuclease
LKHYKQDLEKQIAFKKEFVADADAQDRYFSDEMRYGLHTEHKCLWTPCGIRPDWTLRLSYQYGYLSVALNPLNGHLIAAFLPDMSSESYQAFLALVSEETSAPLRLYRDRAPSHTAGGICVPANITLKEIPPYSPELNPAERFFEELRVLLANIVFESLAAIEAKLTEILQKYWSSPKLLQRLTAFSWIRQPRGKKKQKQTIEN